MTGTCGRRPNILGVHSIDHFAIHVPDIEEARKFYSLFGLDVRDQEQKIELFAKDGTHRWAVISQAPGPKRLEYLSFGCQTAFKRDPRSASKRDPLFR